MADNTTRPVSIGGDEIRDVARTQDDGTVAKTQVMKLAGLDGELVSRARPLRVHNRIALATLGEIRAFARRGVDGFAMPEATAGLNIAAAVSAPMATADPSLLPLSGWWSASFVGTPWAPSASAGTSGTNGSLDVGTAPSVGSAVNGFTPALFAAASSQYIQTLNDPSFFFNLNAGSIAVLFNATTSAPAAPAGQPYADPGIVGLVGGGEIIMAYNSTGLRCAIFDGAYEEAPTISVSANTGAWHLGQMRWDGISVQARVDGGAWQSGSAGSIDSFTGITNVAVAKSVTNAFFDGSVLDAMFADTVRPDGDFETIRAYCAAKYLVSV